MDSSAALALALAAAVVGPLGAYIVAARRLSGKIATSDADSLWTEARSMRDEYRVRLGEANEQIGKLRERVAVVEKENADCLHRNSLLNAEIADLKRGAM